MTTQDELVVALAGRYALGSRADRGRMLDEFAALTGHHRKHAMRLLRAGVPGGRSSSRPERRVYDQATREALIVVWEASDRICGKRLRPLVPILVSAMERHGHLQLAPEVLTGLLTMSAATMDRALREARGATGGRPRRRSPPSAAIRRSVAVRTFSDWNDPPPGFMEADLVAHSGPTAKGSYVQTLTLTDIATGWTECAPVLVREQKLLTEVLSEMRKVLPFVLLGFDTDNDSVFMNQTVQEYCTGAGVEFTRSRPYRKRLLLGSGVVSSSRNQAGDEGAEQGFAASACVVHELEEAEIKRQLVLRDAAVRSQPGAQQRPEAFHGVDMHLAEAVAVFVASVFAAPMADRLVPVAPGWQAGVDAVFVRVDEGARGDGGGDDRLDRGLLHVGQHAQHDLAAALDQAKDRRLVLLQRAAARRACQLAPAPEPALLATAAGCPLCPATT